MWGSFAVAVIVQAVFLFLPGYLLVRAFGVRRLTAFVLAPAFSSALVAVWAEILTRCGAFCSWVTVGIPVIAFSVIAFFVRRLVRHEGSPFVLDDGLARRRAWIFPALFIGVGILVGITVLVLPFADPTDFVQEIDNKAHLHHIRSFVETGAWTSFTGGFYPRAWHAQGALTASLLGTDIALTENALDFAFSCIVAPCSALAFLGVLTGGSRKVLFYGAFVASAFVGCPWGIIQFGPLMPNMAALCTFLAVATLFMQWLAAFGARRGRVSCTVLLALALIGGVLLHPNIVFFGIVFFVPLCVQRLYGLHAETRTRARRLACSIVFLVGVAALWLGAYKLPFLQSTVGAYGQTWGSFLEGAVSAVTLRIPGGGMQAVLGALVVLGALWALTQRRYRWLVFSYTILCLFFVIDYAHDGPLARVLTGFWYSDKFRLFACMAVAGVPLATFGLSFIDDLLRRISPRLAANRPAGKALGAAIAIFFSIVVYSPLSVPDSGARVGASDAFGSLRAALAADTGGSAVIYEDDERRFAHKVIDLIGDARVLNAADDGSLFAYGADGLNVFYTQPSGMMSPYPEASGSESAESLAIRGRLASIASDAEVRAAVDSLGIDYLVLFDVGEALYGQQRMPYGSRPDSYPGIEAVDDDTPGFEVVLAEGDMRLYRIVA